MTTQELYNSFKRNKISRKSFLSELRKDVRLKPFINNFTSAIDSVKILKNRSIITESYLTENSDYDQMVDKILDSLSGGSFEHKDIMMAIESEFGDILNTDEKEKLAMLVKEKHMYDVGHNTDIYEYGNSMDPHDLAGSEDERDAINFSKRISDDGDEFDEFDIEDEDLDEAKNFKYNQPDYKFYIVQINPTGGTKIVEGFEYREDALDRIEEWAEQEGKKLNMFKVVADKTLKSKYQLDANNNSDWANPIFTEIFQEDEDEIYSNMEKMYGNKEINQILTNLDYLGFDSLGKAINAILLEPNFAEDWDIPAEYIDTLTNWRNKYSKLKEIKIMNPIEKAKDAAEEDGLINENLSNIKVKFESPFDMKSVENFASKNNISSNKSGESTLEFRFRDENEKNILTKHLNSLPFYSKILNEAKKSKKLLTLDQVNPYEYKLGIQLELEKLEDYSTEGLEKAKIKTLKNLSKDVNYYTDLVYNKKSPYLFKDPENYKSDKAVAEDGMLVKGKGKLPKTNVKDTLGNKEKGKKNKKIKEMTMVPKKQKGVKVMDLPGKEKKIKLKESIMESQPSSLNEFLASWMKQDPEIKKAYDEGYNCTHGLESNPYNNETDRDKHEAWYLGFISNKNHKDYGKDQSQVSNTKSKVKDIFKHIKEAIALKDKAGNIQYAKDDSEASSITNQARTKGVQLTKSIVNEQEGLETVFDDDREKRYTVTIEMYIWADDDQEASKKADSLVKFFDSNYDNQPKLTSLDYTPYGSFNTKKLKEENE